MVLLSLRQTYQILLLLTYCLTSQLLILQPLQQVLVPLSWSFAVYFRWCLTSSIPLKQVSVTLVKQTYFSRFSSTAATIVVSTAISLKDSQICLIYDSIIPVFVWPSLIIERENYEIIQSLENSCQDLHISDWQYLRFQAYSGPIQVVPFHLPH